MINDEHKDRIFLLNSITADYCQFVQCFAQNSAWKEKDCQTSRVVVGKYHVIYLGFGLNPPPLWKFHSLVWLELPLTEFPIALENYQGVFFRNYYVIS